MQEREYSIKKKVKWKSEENTKLINFYNKKYKNLINNKELNNNYNIEYTKLNKYNKIVYDTIEKNFLYHNYNIIYNNLYNNSYYIISKYINSNKYRNFYKYQNNFIKIFKIKLKLNNIFIKKISTYYKSRHVDVIVDYSDLLKLIKDDKCVPFWNDKIKNISQKIFLPTSDNLIKIKNKKEIKTFNYKNWFETAHYKGLNVLEAIKIDKKRFYNGNTIKCRKIKIYFNKEQKIVINNMFGYYRYYYNRAIQYINNYNKKTQKTYYLIDSKNELSKVNINLSNIQNKFTAITMRNYLKNNKPEWIIQMPSHLIDKAFKEAENSYNNNMKKYMKYRKSFKLKFKTKKDKMQTINIEKQMFGKNNNIFPLIKYNNKFIFKKIKFNETFKKFNYSDSSITCNTKLNEYYLNLNYKCHKNINLKNVKNLKKNKEIMLEKNKVCSIDPGIRCFLTIYSDNGVSEIGLNITEKINKVCKEIDIIKSKINKKINNKFKYNKRKRKSLKKALQLIKD